MYNELDTVTFDRELKRYERAIEAIEDNQSNLTDEQVVEVLIARDDIQFIIHDYKQGTGGGITRLCALDDRLRSLGPTIAESVDLENLRGTLNRATDYWWWTFEPPISAWDRYDWVWNALTAGVLALAASFMVSIYSAFAAGDATVATALSTIVQAAGLAVIGGGALTADGQEKVKKILASLNIQPRFFAEATFILALLLFIAVYFTNRRLDDTFLKSGKAEYKQGSLSNAELAYRQGLEINPDEIEFYQNLGEVYESLGRLEPAFEQYLVGSEAGEPESLNSLGRVVINRPNPITQKSDAALAEAYLLMGLQRAQTSDKSPPYLYYQLNRNIGWALIEQDRYPDAIAYLEAAMEWRSKVGEGRTKEGGMGNCFLAYAYEQERKTAKATDNWRKCIKHGRPNYVHEFRWLISVGKDDVAYCVNTEKVVAGYEKQRRAESNERCDELFAEK